MNVLIVCPLTLSYAKRYIQAAQSAGINPVVVLVRKAKVLIADLGNVDYIEIDSLSKQPLALLELVRSQWTISGVVAGSEFSVEATEYLARQLALPQSFSGDTAIFRDKHAMRTAFHKYGVDQPAVYGIAANARELAEIAESIPKFPVISKPVDMAGSWHVALNHSVEDIIRNATPIFAYTQSFATGLEFKATCLIEDYFEGDEFSAEVIVENSIIEDVFITRKFVSRPPSFDEIAHCVGVQLSESVHLRLMTNIRGVLNAAGVQNAILHVEFKTNATGEMIIIEVGCRVAGDFISDLVEMQHAINLEQRMVELKTRTSTTLSKKTKVGNFGIRFLFSDQKRPDLAPAKLIRSETYNDGRTAEDALSKTHLSRRVGYEIVHTERVSDFEALNR